MDGDASFGAWLKQQRKALDLTQAELARRAGCAMATVQKIEADERHPSRELAERLAVVLEIPPEERATFVKVARTDLVVDQLAHPRHPLREGSRPPAPRREALADGANLPAEPSTRTLTFLVTAIEGSVQLWERYPQAMAAAIARTHALLRGAIASHGGAVFQASGDRLQATFATAPAALAAALAGQRGLAAETWPEVGTLRVQMALHTGIAGARDGTSGGPALQRVSRLLAAGYGGQTLLSRAAVELVRDHLQPGLQLRDLGRHHLPDLAQPEHIFQLVSPDLPTDFPPLKTLVPLLGSLPPQPTSFIGRDTERALLRVLLRRVDVRLVTLTGPGGTGKTRLALHIAAEVRNEFPDGIAFVALASIRAATLVLPGIAKVLGVIDAGDDLLLERLSDALHNQRLLLVLDNFEHVLPAARDIAVLLAASPALKVLVTSRAALHLSWEHAFRVAPLAVPTRGLVPSLDQLGQYDAVRLFVARAQGVRPGFALTGENAAAVAEICRQLDGLPLAIELAAARSQLFSPPALLARLHAASSALDTRRLTLLTGGPQDLPARQRTLRATIDWSYHLLDPWEQAQFARLGVFVGGCTLEVAEAVIPWNTQADEPPHILDRLIALADKSLLRPSQGLDGEPRFVMLETVRAYALEQLATIGELPAIRQRHAQVFLALAEAASAALEGAEQGAWLNRLLQEHDNLRAALAWAIEQHDASIGLRLATALRLFWFMRGHLSEGRAYLAQVLTLDNASLSARATALDCAGFLARYQGDYVAAAALIGESLAIWRSLGHGHGIADALSNLGYVKLHQGEDRAAQDLYEESLELNRTAGNEQGHADCLSHLGAAAFYQGDTATARARHVESLAIWRQLGDIEGVAYALYNLGDVSFSQGEHATAAAWFRESLAASVTLEWPWGIVSAVEGAAGLATLQAHPLAALRLAGFAARLRTTGAIPLMPARSHVLARRLAPAQQVLSEPARAAAWAEGEALTLEQAINQAVAELQLSEGDAARAVESAEVTRATWGGLTAREHEVVRLIGEGKSNRQIATALTVGLKTIEGHTTHILAKLGFSSRAQVAGWAVANGLARAPQDLDSHLR